jgi:hypothetical protein
MKHPRGNSKRTTLTDDRSAPDDRNGAEPMSQSYRENAAIVLFWGVMLCLALFLAGSLLG